MCWMPHIIEKKKGAKQETRKRGGGWRMGDEELIEMLLFEFLPKQTYGKHFHCVA